MTIFDSLIESRLDEAAKAKVVKKGISGFYRGVRSLERAGRSVVRTGASYVRPGLDKATKAKRLRAFRKAKKGWKKELSKASPSQVATASVLGAAGAYGGGIVAYTAGGAAIGAAKGGLAGYKSNVRKVSRHGSLGAYR